MTRTTPISHSRIHWAVTLLLCAILLSSGCLDDDDGDSNKAPTAVAKATPTQAELNYEIQFSGKSSSDPDGDSLTYQWDFDAADGSNDIDSMEKEPSHSYMEEGSYTVTLTVSDGELNSKDTVTVEVVKPQGQLTAKITTEDETTGIIHEGDSDPEDVKEESITVSFSAAESENTDPDSEIEKYEWDYEFDGTFEQDDDEMNGQHDYKSGRHTTMLQVTNTSGATARDSMIVYVNYNQSYNQSGDDDVPAGENQTFALPVNTGYAIKMEVKIVYEVTNLGGLDEDDLELYLYDAGDNEIANTEDQDNGTEIITLGYSEIYKNGPEDALGDWRAVVENQNSVVDKDFEIFIDVMYYIP